MHAAGILEIGVLLLALGLAGRIAARLAVSPVPLYLVVGIAAGRTQLAQEAHDFVELGGEIGALLLLLMLGLEYSTDELVTSARSSWWAGVVDLALNAAPGAAIGIVLGWSLPATFLLAGIGYISSSGIAAKLLDELRWVGNRETPLVISILVFEDLVMAGYLAVAASILGGGDTRTLVTNIGSSIAAVAMFLIVAARFSEPLSRFFFARTSETQLLSLIGGCLTVAALAERLHLSAAVAAFLLGLAVSGEAAHRAEEILSPVRDLFGAVFFVLFGMAIDLSAVGSLLIPAMGLVLLGTVSKWATVELSGRRLHLGTVARRRATALLIARGEFSIVMAELAAVSGLDEPVRPLAALVVVAWATLGPLYARSLASRPAPAARTA